MEIPRRDFLKGATFSPLALAFNNTQTESLDKVFFPPEDQDWTLFRSPNHPYEISHPSLWHYSLAEEYFLNPYSYKELTKADIFGGGIVGRGIMRMIVSSQILEPSPTFEEYKQIIKEEEKAVLTFGGDPIVTHSRWLEDSFVAGRPVLDLTVGRLSGGPYQTSIGERSFFFMDGNRAWRLQFNTAEHEAKVGGLLAPNVSRIMSAMLRSFRLT